MKEIVVILHREAIAPALQLCSTLPDYEVYLFDAALGDPVTAAGLKNVKLFTQVGGPSYVELDAAARACAIALETELDVALRAAGADVSIRGWQHLTFYYLFITLEWYTGLWERIGTHLLQGRVHVLIRDDPAEIHFNSFLPALTLVDYLRRQAAPFVAYDYGGQGTVVYRIPRLPVEPAPAGFEAVLVHLPTCMYDGDYFACELRKIGRPLINLEARYWDVPVEADITIGLTDVCAVTGASASPCDGRLAGCETALRGPLEAALARRIALPVYQARQADHLIHLYRAQLITYYELQRYFQAGALSHLVLSEHDTGFHGPLVSFAEDRALPVTLLPHSKVSGDIEFAYSRIRVLSHPMQGRPIADRDGRPVTHWAVSYPECFAGTSAVGWGMRRISLLLNGLTLGGIPYAPCDLYLDGIKRIVTWCRDHGVDLKIRCRPGYGIAGVLMAYAGVSVAMLPADPNESLEEHVRPCDLCLMYEMPTTGALVPLRNCIPTLNPVVTQPAKGFMANIHPDVVITEDLTATLARLDGFLDEPLSLYSFRDAQFQAYLSLFRRARPLRTFFEPPETHARAVVEMGRGKGQPAVGGRPRNLARS